MGRSPKTEGAIGRNADLIDRDGTSPGVSGFLSRFLKNPLKIGIGYRQYGASTNPSANRQLTARRLPQSRLTPCQLPPGGSYGSRPSDCAPMIACCSLTDFLVDCLADGLKAAVDILVGETKYFQAIFLETKHFDFCHTPFPGAYNAESHPVPPPTLHDGSKNLQYSLRWPFDAETGGNIHAKIETKVVSPGAWCFFAGLWPCQSSAFHMAMTWQISLIPGSGAGAIWGGFSVPGGGSGKTR